MKHSVGNWPGLLGAPATRALLERVLRQSTADETEVALETETAALTRFAHNVIHQNVGEVDATLEVRAVFSRRVGTASTNDLSPARARARVGRGLLTGAPVPEQLDWPGLATHAPPPRDAARPQPVLAFDEAVAGLDPVACAPVLADLPRGPS